MPAADEGRGGGLMPRGNGGYAAANVTVSEMGPLPAVLTRPGLGEKMGHDQELEPDEGYEEWVPEVELDAGDLANALEAIRRSATLHWLGRAFEPVHMLGIADLATRALTGKAVPAPYDLRSVMERSRWVRDAMELHGE